MKKMGVAGACFPYLWRPTSEDPDMKGYVFPYLEGRALLYLHPHLKSIQDSLDGAVYRWMDADVSHEPLFEKSTDDTGELQLQSCLDDLDSYSASVFSGVSMEYGRYFVQTKVSRVKPPTDNEVPKIENMIAIINESELAVREALFSELGSKSMYWPEPALYMNQMKRLNATLNMLKEVENLQERCQQKESTFVIKALGKFDVGIFKPKLVTTKPLKKGYFDKMLIFLVNSLRSNEEPDVFEKELREYVSNIRQTHMSYDNVRKIISWNEGTVSVFENVATICKDALDGCVAKLLKILE